MDEHIELQEIIQAADLPDTVPERFTIDQLIVGMTPQNRHEESFGTAVGSESW